jgi:septal ring-binding cell division protein DamX
MQSNGTLLWKSSPGIDFATATDVADGQWHHMAAVHEGSVARLYVDGVEAASDSTPGSASMPVASAFFGAQYGTTRFMKGPLDEFRFSNIPRSSNWVWAVYQNIASNTTFATYGNVTATPAPAPTFSAADMIGGAMSFQVSGEPRYSYTIQGSTNLVTWTDLFTTNPVAMPFNWSDNSLTNFPAHFYRVLLQP